MANPKWPNSLRAARESKHLTRKQLALLTAEKANENTILMSAVAESTIEKLEAGTTRPRPSSAHALAAVLDQTIDGLFPHGTQNRVTNPAGKTRIPRQRPPRGPGKPKKPKSP